MKVSELIERLLAFDGEMTVYFEAEAGPCEITEVNQTPIVWLHEGECGNGVVIGQGSSSADALSEWVSEQREGHAKYTRTYPRE